MGIKPQDSPGLPLFDKRPWSWAPGYPPAPTHTCTSRRASSSTAAGRVRRTLAEFSGAACMGNEQDFRAPSDQTKNAPPPPETKKKGRRWRCAVAAGGRGGGTLQRRWRAAAMGGVGGGRWRRAQQRRTAAAGGGGGGVL
eukprot:gene25075-biopygen8988